MVYTIYAVENKINGDRYIGLTGRSLSRRWTEHVCHAQKLVNQGHFYRAIRKYGSDVFKIYELDFCDTHQEAKQIEIKAIATLKPKYNSTLGGDGRLGGKFTENGLKKIKEAWIGNKWRLGKSHNESTRKKLKVAALKNTDKWKKYSVLGPASMARRVICLDDGNIYLSASEAARAYNVSKSAIIELCLGKNGRKTVGGKRFSYEVPNGI